MTRKIAELGVFAAALPWIRNEWPAWGRVYNLFGLGVANDAHWKNAGWRKLRLKDSGCDAWLDLSSNFERGTFFLGRYQESELKLAIEAVLRKGDQFVDGGANIGLLSLLAASIVGRDGKVVSFEPNPEVSVRVREHAEINNLTQLELHECGLSDVTAELTFRIIDGGSETGTMAMLDDEQMGAVTGEQIVSVRNGDEVLLPVLSPDRRTFIKLDVEGFETQAVKGLLGVIEKCRPVLTTEYQKHLTRREDLDELFKILSGHGYTAFSLGLERAGIGGHSLKLAPLKNAADLANRTDKSDVLWLLPEAHGYFSDVLNAG